MLLSFRNKFVRSPSECCVGHNTCATSITLNILSLSLGTLSTLLTWSLSSSFSVYLILSILTSPSPKTKSNIPKRKRGVWTWPLSEASQILFAYHGASLQLGQPQWVRGLQLSFSATDHEGSLQSTDTSLLNMSMLCFVCGQIGNNVHLPEF